VSVSSAIGSPIWYAGGVAGISVAAMFTRLGDDGRAYATQDNLAEPAQTEATS
jgi:hypothetical protein